MGKSLTGIERLRDIAYDGPYSGGMVHISVQRLREICEQIEAESGGCRPLLGIDGSPIVPGEVYYGQSDGKRWRIDAVGVLFAWAGLSKTARMRGEGPKRLRPEWLSREPPAPKVLDADGVEIRVGDEVWDSSTGDALIVRAINDDGKTIACRYVDVDGNAVPVHGMWSPTWLTHRAPVLAADGKPLREGETVWHEDGTKLRVIGFLHEEDGETLVKVERVSGPTNWSECRSLSSMHDRPSDSWLALEAEALDMDELWAFEYGNDIEETTRARNLVRRAKAVRDREIAEMGGR